LLTFTLVSDFNELFLVKQSQIFEALVGLRTTLTHHDIHAKLITHTNTICEEFLAQGSDEVGQAAA
jgi:hypothetical protein